LMLSKLRAHGAGTTVVLAEAGFGWSTLDGPCGGDGDCGFEPTDCYLTAEREVGRLFSEGDTAPQTSPRLTTVQLR
jgi:hypothetical protein